jgi:NTE family protein
MCSVTDFDLTPVSTEAPSEPMLRKGIGLCLSGGGYRAMLFHLGVVWRLAELGYLGTERRHGKYGELGSLQRVSSVSGGSITAGVLGLAWDRLDVDSPGLSERFRELVASPIQDFASQSTVNVLSGLAAIVVSSVNKRVVRIYRKRLYGDATLQDLPAVPDFVMNTTNLQSGALWSFSRRAARDWRVGRIENPVDTIAKVVGASSAFPPFLSPARFKYKDEEFTPGSGDGLQGPPFTTRPLLTDGGVYDNLGLETVFKNYKTVICSDAGADLAAKKKVPGDWVLQGFRVVKTINNQVRSLRKRILLTSLVEHDRHGTYWSMRTDIRKYPAPDKLPCPFARTQELANLPTDLAAKDEDTQRRLINWGYALCDAGIRSWVEEGLPPPNDFPFPAEGV